MEFGLRTSLNRSPREEFRRIAAKKIGRRWQVGALPKRRIYKENQCRDFEEHVGSHVRDEGLCTTEEYSGKLAADHAD